MVIAQDTREREKEFERKLEMSKEQAYNMTREAFDIIIQYLEHLNSNPELLMSQPFLNRPPPTAVLLIDMQNLHFSFSECFIGITVTPLTKRS